MKFVKTKSAQQKGDYRNTSIDDRKSLVDFLVNQVSPKNIIVWRDGSRQQVSDKQLQKLQKSHSWATDF